MSTDLHSTPPLPSPAPKRRTWRRWFVRSLLIYIGVPYVAIFVLMSVYQRDFIYQPKKTSRLLAETISSTPPVDDVELQTSDGLTIHGWRYRAVAGKDAKFLVIYFPGNAGCRAGRVSDCRDFTQLGFDVILFDYRGYGDNPGSPSEAMLANDANQVWKFATTQLHYSPDRIVLFGESMGGAMQSPVKRFQLQLAISIRRSPNSIPDRTASLKMPLARRKMANSGQSPLATVLLQKPAKLTIR